MHPKIVALIACMLVLTACTQASGTNVETSEITAPVQQAVQNVVPTPTPLPFQEMTIPYLRAKKFTSSLAELKPYQNNSSYESFLTSYPSENNARIDALLTRPKGEMPPGGWPAIVFVHGYIPPSTYRTTEKYVEYVNYLARNGFVVIKIDLRGHGNSEGEAGGGYYSDDYVQDTLYARAALQSTDFVNPNNIGLWGHSMAGNVTLRALASQPDIPAIVIWAGAVYTYSDMRQFQISDNSYRPPASTAPSRQERQRLFDTHGNFDPNSPFWQQVAPTNYLSGIQGAIQIHHAIDDDVVDISYSRNLNQLLNQTTIKHQLYEYPTGGHNINGTSFTQAMQRTVEFFNNNVADKIQ